MAIVDLAFALEGTTIPSDHGYSLYGAVCRVFEQHARAQCRTVSASAHDSHEGAVRGDGHLGFAIHAIAGTYVGNRKLQLSSRSRLRLRVSTDGIPACLALAGKALDLDGHRLRVGVPTVHALVPAATLVARLVTIKGFKEPAPFLDAARRQLDQLGVSREAELSIPLARSGPGAGQPRRRVLRVKDKLVVGFSVHITGLAAEESLLLQGHTGIRSPDGDGYLVPPLGLGGRRTMGAGIFVPAGAGA